MNYNGYGYNSNSAYSAQSRLSQSLYSYSTTHDPYGGINGTQSRSLTPEQIKEEQQNREIMWRNVHRDGASPDSSNSSNSFNSSVPTTNWPTYPPSSNVNQYSNPSSIPTPTTRQSSEHPPSFRNSYPAVGTSSQPTTSLFPKFNDDWLIREQEQQKQQKQHMEQMQENAARMYQQQQAYEAYHNSLSHSVCMPGITRTASDSFPSELSPPAQLPTPESRVSLFPPLPNTTEVQWGKPSQPISSPIPNPNSSMPPSTPLFPSIPIPSSSPKPAFPSPPGMEARYCNEVASEEEDDEEDDKEDEEENKELDLLMSSINVSTADREESSVLHNSIQMLEINREGLNRLKRQRVEALRKVAENAEKSVEELKELDVRIQQQKAELARYWEIYFRHIERCKEREKQREAEREQKAAEREQKAARRAIEVLEKKKQRQKEKEEKRLKKEEERKARNARRQRK